MTKPYLFLDIDGVLNSFGGGVWGDEQEYELSPFGEGPFVVTLSNRMAIAINSLDCELWWTTTWQTEAYMVGDIIGLHGQVLNLDRGMGWKRGAVERHLDADPRPFVWFEDETGGYGTNNDKHMDHLPPRFVWNPSIVTGITPMVIEQAREFLDQHRS